MERRDELDMMSQEVKKSGNFNIDAQATETSDELKMSS